jgi:hypothetical protein
MCLAEQAPAVKFLLFPFPKIPCLAFSQALSGKLSIVKNFA